MRTNRKYILFTVLMVLALTLAGCPTAADTASTNLSTAADNFEILRKITFYNGITDTDILVMEGFCSLGNYDTANRMSVTCLVGNGRYVKHFLGLSDNVTFVSEQLDPTGVSRYYNRVIWRPGTIIPDIELDLNNTPVE